MSIDHSLFKDSQRSLILREGRRWDVIFMGILGKDWLKLEQENKKENL